MTESGGARYRCLVVNEPRGDKTDAWGTLTLSYEVDQDGRPIRQLQVYANALFVYRLDRDTPVLQHAKGVRTAVTRTEPLDAASVEQHEIAKNEFDRAWKAGHTHSRPIRDYRNELLGSSADFGRDPLGYAWALAVGGIQNCGRANRFLLRKGPLLV